MGDHNLASIGRQKDLNGTTTAAPVCNENVTSRLTPGLQAKSTSVCCNLGSNGPKSKNKLKNAQNARKT